jgi:hypothetical protein
MNQYMVLLYASKENNIEAVPEKDRAAIYQKFGQWVGGLVQKNQFVGGEPLSNSSKSLRSSGKAVVDGPYLEAKEFMNGYFIIRAESLDEATEICKSHPCFLHGGGLEVVEMAELQGGPAND